MKLTFEEIKFFYKYIFIIFIMFKRYIDFVEQRVAIKKIFKKDLIGPYMKRQAAQEFPLHCSLKHENIVKAFEWCENEEEYTMEMEFMNKAEYLKDKIDVVRYRD